MSEHDRHRHGPDDYTELLELDGAAPTAADLRRIGQFASAAGAVMAGVAGAMQAMPTRPAIAALLAG